MARWQVPIPAEPEHTRGPIQYDNGVDMELTPAEKSEAAVASIHLERERRKANAEDAHKSECKRIAALKRDRELQAALYDGDGPRAA